MPSKSSALKTNRKDVKESIFLTAREWTNVTAASWKHAPKVQANNVAPVHVALQTAPTSQ
jgi:hypothetical protein